MCSNFSSNELTSTIDIRLEDKHLMQITSSLSVLLYRTRNCPSLFWICDLLAILSVDANTSSSSSLLRFIVPNSQISFNKCARHSCLHCVHKQFPLTSKQPDIRIEYKWPSPPYSINCSPHEAICTCEVAVSFSSSLSEMSESLLRRE